MPLLKSTSAQSDWHTDQFVSRCTVFTLNCTFIQFVCFSEDECVHAACQDQFVKKRQANASVHRYF